MEDSRSGPGKEFIYVNIGIKEGGEEDIDEILSLRYRDRHWSSESDYVPCEVMVLKRHFLLSEMVGKYCRFFLKSCKGHGFDGCGRRSQ